MLETDVQSETDQVTKWLTGKLSDFTGVPPEEITVTDTVESLGLDSAGAVSLICEIEEYVGLKDPLEPEQIFEHDTVRALSVFVTDLQKAA